MTNTVTIVADSGVYQQKQGYERLMLVSHWNPEDDMQLARIWIRVDRIPAESFAQADIYTLDGGFQKVVVIPHQDWWWDMPGYLRWAQDTSGVKTHRLATRLVDELRRVATEAEV